MEEKKKKKMCFYVTEEEKEILMEKVKKAQYESLNSYIRHKLFDENNSEVSALLGFIDTDEVLDGTVERNYQVKTTLSKEEYEYVKKISRNMSISAFLRKTILTANNGRFTFEVKTDDLLDVNKSLSEFNMRIMGIIGALRFRTELYKKDIEKMEELLEEVNENVKKQTDMAKKDRNYVRKKGIDYLKEQINKVVSVPASEDNETK